jgi:hypothetical protein
MDKYNFTYKDIIGIWYGLAVCAYAGKSICNDCRKFFNFRNKNFLKT